MLWHLAWHYPEPVPTELHSIIIPSVVASLPYLIRARQCLIMHTIGSMKVRVHLKHALYRYSSACIPTNTYRNNKE